MQDTCKVLLKKGARDGIENAGAKVVKDSAGEGARSTTILGSDQTGRVIPFTKGTGARTLDNGLTLDQWNALSPRQQRKVNDGELRKHIKDGDRFRDIGPDNRRRSLDVRLAELQRLRERGIPVEAVHVMKFVE